MNWIWSTVALWSVWIGASSAIIACGDPAVGTGVFGCWAASYEKKIISMVLGKGRECQRLGEGLLRARVVLSGIPSAFSLPHFLRTMYLKHSRLTCTGQLLRRVCHIIPIVIRTTRIILKGVKQSIPMPNFMDRGPTLIVRLESPAGHR